MISCGIHSLFAFDWLVHSLNYLIGLEKLHVTDYQTNLSVYHIIHDITNARLEHLSTKQNCYDERAEKLALYHIGKDLTKRPGFYIPECEVDGSYKVRQCDTNKGDDGHCWCVNTRNGQEYGKTRNTRKSFRVKDDCRLYSSFGE